MSALIRQIDRTEHVKKEGMYLRRIVRRNAGGLLTNSEVKVLVSLVNLWLHHRNGPKGFIHPGRKVLAKKAGVKVITVARALDVFRKLGLVSAVKHIKGGNGRATQYTVNTVEIEALFDPHNVTTKAGQLVVFSVSSKRQNDTQQPYQNDTLSIGIVQHRPSQGSDSFGGQRDE